MKNIDDWRQERLTGLAEAAAAGDREATLHCIRKWEGLRKAVLDAHGMKKSILERRIVESRADPVARVGVTVETCALCVRQGVDFSCYDCPLYHVRGNVACDVRAVGEEYSPYFHWVYTGDPEPMIGWLRRTLEMLDKEEAQS